MKILLIEDDRQTADYIAKGLRQHGHVVDQVDNGRDGLYMATGEPYDVMVVDRHLPKMDGLSMVKAARDAGMRTPALFLTTMGGVDDRVAGLEAGADDYLPKPFELSILLVRLKSLLRRASWQSATAASETPADQYTFDNRTIRFDTLELIAPDHTTQLTVMEADLLRYLTDREGQIVPRKDILEQVWRVHEDTDTRAIDNFIVRLRRYIEDDPGKPKHLITVRGVGYRFLANP